MLFRGTGRPLLLTAFDLEQDPENHAAFWKWHFDEELVYERNPFAALPLLHNTIGQMDIPVCFMVQIAI